MARINKTFGTRIKKFHDLFNDYYGFNDIEVNDNPFDEEVALFKNDKNPEYRWRIKWDREKQSTHETDVFTIWYEKCDEVCTGTIGQYVIFKGTFGLNNKGFINRILYDCYNTDNIQRK